MRDWKKNYYKLLGIEPSVNQEEVDSAYRRLAKRCHPDTNQDEDASEQMKEINEAYAVLGNPSNRRQYDRQRSNRAAVMDGNPGKVVHVRVNQRPQSSTTQTDYEQNKNLVFTLFTVGGRWMAIETHNIIGSSYMKPLVTPDLKSNPYTHWIIYTKGREVPIIDLNRLFGLKSSRDHNTRIVYLNVEGLRIGLIVDSILGEHEISADSIRTLSPYEELSLDTPISAYFYGNDQIVSILSPEMLFSQEGLTRLQQLFS